MRSPSAARDGDHTGDPRRHRRAHADPPFEAPQKAGPGAIVEVDGERYVLVPAPRARSEPPRGAEPAMVSRLHLALAQSEGGNSLSLTDIARQLRLPARTLAHRLHHEGTTFTRERERFRRERSLLRVVQSDTPLTTIALDLGFSDLATFCRAFRGWYRCAASTLRRSRSSR